jgi:hypothetical protein
MALPVRMGSDQKFSETAAFERERSLGKKRVFTRWS